MGQPLTVSVEGMPLYAQGGKSSRRFRDEVWSDTTHRRSKRPAPGRVRDKEIGSSQEIHRWVVFPSRARDGGFSSNY